MKSDQAQKCAEEIRDRAHHPIDFDISMCRQILTRHGAFADGEEWVSVKDAMPDAFTPVELVNIESWENYEMQIPISATGYWNNSFPSMVDGGHWSIRGQRATQAGAFTHWRYSRYPLPPPPKMEGE